jgi:hypothetical protein
MIYEHMQLVNFIKNLYTTNEVKTESYRNNCLIIDDVIVPEIVSNYSDTKISINRGEHYCNLIDRMFVKKI